MNTEPKTTMNSPFTLSQWQELEQQALIFKYLMAGLPIPPDLVLPIQKNISSLSPGFFHHSNVGYCPLYGKVMDPEPGRCRRTDGKKWRCAKEAYPDSKYCERHMHRGRNRSRKPVESSQTNSSISSGYAGGPYPGTDRTCHQEMKEGVNHRLSSKRVQVEEVGNDCQGYVSFGKASDDGLVQSEIGSFALYSLKEEEHSVRPFFDEWRNGKDAWCGLEDEYPNSTQLSICIPNSQPPHET